jgi:hypothetical protein
MVPRPHSLRPTMDVTTLPHALGLPFSVGASTVHLDRKRQRDRIVNGRRLHRSGSPCLVVRSIARSKSTPPERVVPPAPDHRIPRHNGHASESVPDDSASICSSRDLGRARDVMSLAIAHPHPQWGTKFHVPRVELQLASCLPRSTGKLANRPDLRHTGRSRSSSILTISILPAFAKSAARWFLYGG